MKKADILKQAKNIMDEFAKALNAVELDEEVGIEREEQTRKAVVADSNSEFIKRFLKNAPKTKEGYILAERKKW